MTAGEKTINLRLTDFEEPGLYLILKDSTELVLTRENIEKVTREYWSNPHKIPPDVKEAVDFQRCPFCPLKGTDDMCDALRPTLPFLDAVDRYSSYDEVTAIYKGDEEGLCHVAHTTMQRAIRYISNLSLMEYCQAGRKYGKYFLGTMPIMGAEEIADRIYLNMYWAHGGDKKPVDKLILRFNDEMTRATHNQMSRFRMICRNDVLQNAFVLTVVITEVLEMNRDSRLKEFLGGSSSET